MICPYCKSNIDNDSCYCDQCGNEIFVCSSCGRPGKGKACTQDGKPLIPAKETLKAQTPTPTGRGIVLSGSVPKSSEGTHKVVAVPGRQSQSLDLILINKTLNLILEIQPGDIIGRSEGRFADKFSQHKRISRRHCVFQMDPHVGWTVTDLGSTNGTKYNSKSLEPNKPWVLESGSYLIIGNIEFYVELRNHLDPNATERR